MSSMIISKILSLANLFFALGNIYIWAELHKPINITIGALCFFVAIIAWGEND